MHGMVCPLMAVTSDTRHASVTGVSTSLESHALSSYPYGSTMSLHCTMHFVDLVTGVWVGEEVPALEGSLPNRVCLEFKRLRLEATRLCADPWSFWEGKSDCCSRDEQLVLGDATLLPKVLAEGVELLVLGFLVTSWSLEVWSMSPSVE